MAGLLLSAKDKRLCFHTDLANVRSVSDVTESAQPKGHVSVSDY